MTRRMGRVNNLLREELSSLIQHDLKDPRLVGLVTVTEVDTSVDLEHARVYISVMGTDQEWNGVMAGLASAAGYLRRELRARLSLKRIPELHFLADRSIEQGAHLLTLMDQVASERKGQET